jgi:hypothetical protein
MLFFVLTGFSVMNINNNKAVKNVHPGTTQEHFVPLFGPGMVLRKYAVRLNKIK